MNEIKTKLEESIESGLERLNSTQPGSDEWRKMIDHVDTLYRLKLDEDKLKLEEKKASEQMKAEAKKSKEQRLINWVNIGVQAGTTIFTAICYDIWLNRGYKFEENGTIRSPHMRNLISRIMPRFK